MTEITSRLLFVPPSYSHSNQNVKRVAANLNSILFSKQFQQKKTKKGEKRLVQLQVVVKQLLHFVFL